MIHGSDSENYVCLTPTILLSMTREKLFFSSAIVMRS